MTYTFDILGISPVISFFNQQQVIADRPSPSGVEYLATNKCTLDAFLESVETVSTQAEWNLDRVVETVIEFWMNNPDSIWYWKERLEDAGDRNLLVGRVAEMDSLRHTFESLFQE
ncbi:hypothetical protein [Oxynema aestuarii]|jgi:predicted GTPase|uniref:Uncharacterized protein n=1 Tax=Oxynema aestuarii AP17 TaxID=2064643 RepID=A0A6H1TT48_9CYAN|nr:hypothetical protein [Oxynema aestuarii]QIZ69762.1 hypothetical protein HCG48_03515 [Oxynema aestuarii AP17]RMH71984.1 MAG: hypothetical protein D6680_20380 [Cyanobacteria bacterium J007]